MAFLKEVLPKMRKGFICEIDGAPNNQMQTFLKGSLSPGFLALGRPLVASAALAPFPDLVAGRHQTKISTVRKEAKPIGAHVSVCVYF